MYVSRLCKKSYGKYILHVESMQKTYGIIPRSSISKQNLWWVSINKRRHQGEQLYHYISYVKNDPVNTEVKTEDVKNQQKFNTEQDFREEEDVQKTIVTVSLERQEN